MTQDFTLSRRGFATSIAAAMSALALSGCARSRGITARGYGPLVADPNGLLDLPRGFSYRTVSRLGDAMSDGRTVPDRADGMGCIALPGGRHALVRNHELAVRHIGPTSPHDAAAAPLAFDAVPDGRPLPGGTTTLIIDDATGALVSQHLSLIGTIRNCAGGVTPWGSWLSCEEDVTRAGDGVGQDHGWLFEVPAAAPGLIPAVPLRAMGRFNHEAAAVDPRSGIVYMTEDRDDGLLYRFIPTTPGRLIDGGRLQALAISEPGVSDSRNWDRMAMPEGRWLSVRWVELDAVDSPADDLRLRGIARGATPFARGEGIIWADGELFVCCTSGGAAQLGQIFRLTPGSGQSDTDGRLQLFFESKDAAMFNFGDNLTIAPHGDLIVCEDQYTDVVANRLIGITPQGASYVFAALKTQTELAGACFSPDGRTLYVNAYSPTATLAITGPWG